MLFDVRSFVVAERFVDFLRSAKHLLENGFYILAASLAGAVLEDGLRKLCAKNSITVPEKTKIDQFER